MALNKETSDKKLNPSKPSLDEMHVISGWWLKASNQENWEEYFLRVLDHLGHLYVHVHVSDSNPSLGRYESPGDPSYQLEIGQKIEGTIEFLVEELREKYELRVEVKEKLIALRKKAEHLQSNLNFGQANVTHIVFKNSLPYLEYGNSHLPPMPKDFDEEILEQINLQKEILNRLAKAIRIAEERINLNIDLIEESPYKYKGEKSDIVEVVYALTRQYNIESSETKTFSREQFYRDFLRFLSIEPPKGNYSNVLSSLKQNRSKEVAKFLLESAKGMQEEKTKGPKDKDNASRK